MTLFLIGYRCARCGEPSTVGLEPVRLLDGVVQGPLESPGLDLIVSPDFRPACPICGGELHRDDSIPGAILEHERLDERSDEL